MPCRRKSQIAYEYAERQSLERSTFWVKANSIDNFVDGFVSIVRILNVELTVPQDTRGKLEAIKDYLENTQSRSWLIVLDKADEKELFMRQPNRIGLMEYLPWAEHGRILMTTRDSRIAGLTDGQVVPAQNRICVGPFPTEEGVALFHKCVRTDLAQDSSPEDINSFVTMLGGLPLAIVQAASFIREEEESIHEFTRLYEDVEHHEHLFQEESLSIDLEQKSVLYTWEISYRRIAGPLYPQSKSPAAIVLDLLGFLDAQDSSTRSLTETQNASLEDSGQVENNAWLDHILGPQTSPRKFVSGIYNKYVHRRKRLSSAVGKLRNYSLVNTRDCWVHPVVHSWIYRRLSAEDRHQYFSWVLEELSDSLECRSRSGWQHVLPNVKEGSVAIVNLDTIRNSKAQLELVLSPRMIQHRRDTETSIPGLGDFLSKLGAELAVDLKPEEGSHYLELAVRDAKEMGSPCSLIFARELEYLKVKRRIVIPRQATQETRDLLSASASGSDEHILEARILLAECLVSENMVLEATKELEEIEAWSPVTVDTMEHQESLVALKLSIATALGELGDPSSMTKSREMLDSLIELVCATYQGHILKIILAQALFKFRFEFAEDRRDRCNVCRRLVAFETADEIPFHPIMGAVPEHWIQYLENLRDEQQWEKLEDFAKTCTEFRATLFDMLKYRASKGDNYDRIGYVRQMEPVEFGDGYVDAVLGFAEMHDLLGQAQFHLGNVEAAEQNFWTVFVLHLFATPWIKYTDMWKEHLHHLAACLYQQGKRRREELETLMSSYPVYICKAVDALGPVHQTFKSKKRNFGQY
jgi:hypothetical protein